jgi:hypothetical protein
MQIDIKISERTRQEIVAGLREIADQIDREHPTVNHWGGHLGRAGSYSVTIIDYTEAVRTDL